MVGERPRAIRAPVQALRESDCRPAETWLKCSPCFGIFSGASVQLDISTVTLWWGDEELKQVLWIHAVQFLLVNV